MVPTDHKEPAMTSFDSYEVSVQYIDDSDPFNVLGTIKHAEPSPPLKYSFVSDIPLCDQIAGLKKALKAPHKVVFFIIIV